MRRRYECICNPGYESSETGHACRDVDECRDNPRVCRRGRCRNSPGAYECECEPGFRASAPGYCADVDECADRSVCQVLIISASFDTLPCLVGSLRSFVMTHCAPITFRSKL